MLIEGLSAELTRNLIPLHHTFRDIVMNFMIAGRDTTACALSWTLFELAKHPDVVEEILAEIEKIHGDINEGGDSISYDNLQKMTYTKAVATEVLRLHPSVPVDMKFAKNSDTLPDGTYIPKGCAVLYSPFAMGRNESIWGDDAEEFKPERHLAEDKCKFMDPSQYKFTSFNAGQRLCLGKDLALLEIKLALR